MLALLVLTPAVLALATPLSSHPRSETDTGAPTDLLLRYHRDIVSNQTELSLSTLDKSHTYSHGCGNSLEVAGRTVSVAVNDRGAGNVLIDAEEYRILGDRQMSGGASCTKLYNDRSVVVECSVPWYANMEDLSAISDDRVEECFSEESAAHRRSLPTSFAPSVVSAVEKRQGLCMWFYADNTDLVGDGNPHQDYLHRQVGPSQTCAQRGTCFVGVGEEVSITVSAEIAGIGPWISGGFGVSRTVSSSTERGCYGEAGDTVCQWSSTHHTAYTVTTRSVGTCGSSRYEGEPSAPYVIRSPNSGNNAVDWYCVLNTCRGDGDFYWDLGRAGGP
ncbi:unnamed protein product [Parascedosporium putredinis]|uniref:Uncharacterized protein n=1 Tax=Parascedosporium putredinis TaxID=1442378 RepID=A0A9P1H1L7_9PEZI|nr:unnamed protein product [Parascedosporium putredinis]CAI7993918.1 unnamed protein product [Parascedosporium putredinis]